MSIYRSLNFRSGINILYNSKGPSPDDIDEFVTSLDMQLDVEAIRLLKAMLYERKYQMAKAARIIAGLVLYNSLPNDIIHIIQQYI